MSDTLKEAEKAVLDDYKQKFDALLTVAALYEKDDRELFMACMKKASGCKLMIEHLESKLT